MKRTFILPRDTDMLSLVADTRTSSEAAILWFLRAHQLQHGRGATKEEIMLNVNVSVNTFDRAWLRLKRAGLVQDVKVYSLKVDEGGSTHTA